MTHWVGTANLALLLPLGLTLFLLLPFTSVAVHVSKWPSNLASAQEESLYYRSGLGSDKGPAERKRTKQFDL